MKIQNKINYEKARDLLKTYFVYTMYKMFPKKSFEYDAKRFFEIYTRTLSYREYTINKGANVFSESVLKKILHGLITEMKQHKENIKNKKELDRVMLWFVEKFKIHLTLPDIEKIKQIINNSNMINVK